jgi:predicted permease
MRISLEIVLPVFALILCGFVFARAQVLSAEGIKGLSAFVFYVAIPALLFRSMAAGVLREGMNLDVVYVYYIGAMIMFATAMMIGRFAFGLDLAKQSLLAMNATFSNAVLLGIPLIFTAFGTAGQVAVLLIASLHSLVLFTLATVLIEVGLGAGRAPGRVAGATALAVARNPFMISVAVGSVWGFAGLDVPVPLDTFTRLLAGAAAPAALFALGATLAEFRLGGDMRDVAAIVVLKMLVHPALVWVLATQLFRLGPIDTAVVVIVAALPTGANPFILAQRYDIYVQRSASSVVITTALSVLSAALLLAWYAQAP